MTIYYLHWILVLLFFGSDQQVTVASVTDSKLHLKIPAMAEHLSKGSQEPPPVEGKIRLYSMRYCPYVERAQLVLLAKNIPHDVVFINLTEKPEWYTQSVPTGKVPALRTEGTLLYESLIICDYLDEKFEGRKLNPSNPLQKALDKIFLESLGKLSPALYKCVMGEGTNENTFGELLSALDPLEKELANRGTPYLGGAAPSMVDYMIWPAVERLGILAVLSGPKYVIPKDRFPLLLKYEALLKEDSAVQQYYLSAEQHAEHIKKRKAGLATAYN